MSAGATTAPHSITVEGAVTGRIVGRRRCSKRLAFYDLHDLANLQGADALASALAAAVASSTGAAINNQVDGGGDDAGFSRSPTQVELVAKAGTKGFTDEAALAAAQKDTLKLGNVVRCVGTWSIGGEERVVFFLRSHQVCFIFTRRMFGSTLAHTETLARPSSDTSSVARLERKDGEEGRDV